MTFPQFDGWRVLEPDERISEKARYASPTSRHASVRTPHHDNVPDNWLYSKHGEFLKYINYQGAYYVPSDGNAAPSSTKGKAYLQFGLHPIHSKPLPLP